jgi:small subunit ribosomal protein S4
MVNDHVLDIPSAQLKAGDVISVRPRSRNSPVFEDAKGRGGRRYSWIEVEKGSLSGKFLDAPQREDIPENIREQLIVELYSK